MASTTYYYTAPGYYASDSFAGTLKEPEKIHPEPFYLHPNSYPPPPQRIPFASSRGRFVSPCFAFLFVLFLLTTISILIAWAVLSDGFKNVDTRGRRTPAASARYKTTEMKTSKYLLPNAAGGDKMDIQPETCTSEACALVAADILKNMDRTMDPCDDFYEFTCGNYKQHHSLSEDRRRINVLADVGIQLKRQLKLLLEAPRSASDRRSTRSAKTFYQSCMDIKRIQELGLAPMNKLIQRLFEDFGGWPVLNRSWTSDGFKWEKQAGDMRRYVGVEGVISAFVYVDMEDSDVRLLTLDQPVMGLGSRDYYMKGKKSPLMTAYLDYMVETAVSMGATQKQAYDNMNQVLDFEILMANISVPEEERRDHSRLYNPMTLRKLKTDIPQIDWDLLLEEVLSNTKIVLTEREKLNIVGLQYLRQLQSILRITSKKAIANYLVWNMISAYTSYLPLEYRAPYQKFRAIYSGVTKDKPRWLECVGSTRAFMSWPLSAMYVDSYFDANAKHEMEALVTNLREVTRKNLERGDWMDPGTKRAALLKLSKMGQKIGYPSYVFNESKLMEDYEGVHLSSLNYFDNIVRITDSKIRKTMNELRKAVDKSEWGVPSAIVNAFYSFSKNELVFPAGILQFPVFTLEAPRYANYPRIGMVIGHEITHGYDDQGRQYDSNGNLRSWWNRQTLELFSKKSECFEKQYGSIVEPSSKLKLNGKITVGENIADNGGLRIAHEAYKLWKMKTRNKAEPALPGLQNYTNEQMFFIGFASGWCEIVRPEAVEFYITVDMHSLAHYRVNLPLQNFAPFASAFQCGFNSKMRPREEEKCKIW